MSTTLKTAGEQTMLYRYDQLNRIKTAVSTQNTYQTGYSYDANGNILSLLRNDHNNNTIDNLSYSYNTNVNNRLNSVNDVSGNNEGLEANGVHSYTYDDIGNLTSDRDIQNINWTVYGKIESVLKRDGTEIDYKYDGTGQRIYKKVATSSVIKETHYVRDGSGNVLAIYENKVIDELVIYGSSRLGSYNAKTDQGKRTLGNKKYELSNHLGNVLSVISDNKIGIDSDADLVADVYEPLVISESDYYPFGMAMKERSFQNEEYRFGFNTQEKSTEIGEDTYTAEFWQYDSKIARRWNNDPRPNTSISVYAAFAGNPIWFNDVKGDTSVWFKPDGSFWKIMDDGKKEWSGKLWKTLDVVKKKNNDDGTTTTTYKGNTLNFEFADPINDVKDIKNGVITRVSVVSKNKIKSMLIDAGAFNSENRRNAIQYLSKEGIGGGKLDFSYTSIPQNFPEASSNPLETPSSTIFLVDNVAHNHMNFGNFLFGAAGSTLGVAKGVLKMGAHKNSLFPENANGKRMGKNNQNGYNPQLDSSDDQYSISLGAEYVHGGIFSRLWNSRNWDTLNEEEASKN